MKTDRELQQDVIAELDWDASVPPVLAWKSKEALSP